MPLDHLLRLLAQVWDDDGEFLLVEAANWLPAWLEPDTSANRVFLHQAQLHVVAPLSQRSASQVPKLTLLEGLRAIVDTRVPTLASRPIQMAIDRKLTEANQQAAAGIMHRWYGNGWGNLTP